MYTIIGSDGAEYGPVSEAQIRAWVQAARADVNTKIRREGEAVWSTIGDLPEFSGSSHVPPPVYSAAAAAAAPAGEFDPSSSAADIAQTIFARGGRINVGNAFERGWAVFKGNFWPNVGVSFVLVVLAAMVQQILAAMMGVKPVSPSSDPIDAARALSATFLWSIPILSAVSMLFISGLQYYFLLQLRGQPATIGDAFKGFSRTLPVLGVTILMVVFIWVGLLFLILPGIYLAVAYCYAPILVVDKGLSPLKALEVSRKLVSRQWFAVLGIILLYILLLLAGLCALIIGIFIALPVVRLAMMAAYDDVLDPKH